ncbi:MAG: NAD(P)H-dependent glycerol-3-phosphate dehydrogenase [Clostridiales Family XIII bacterium]|jgi:glycerol-3-phosphate dehydrogenase (NAD(P)+)|nr:NAD(P)H-dependent glycerol-3-phosphate dehydrogenase [Clostridiales Family XIII bacterium]
MKQKIAVIGAGSWGTALAISLGSKGHETVIWDVDKDLLAGIDKSRENGRYLPGIRLNDNIVVAYDMKVALDGADMALFAVPAQHFREAAISAARYLEGGTPVVNAAKGIEEKTLKTLSEVSRELLPNHGYAVVSGPSHAEEVGQAMPTTLVAAAKEIKLAEYVQDVFMTERFRVYTNTDVQGVELGGALKNIIALCAGISDGMGFGDNAKAALMTRGLVEMARLGERLGGKRETFFGLSGVGDLIVTCTSAHSRNRRCGIMIGEGAPPNEAMERVGMVVEGVYTARAAYKLSKITGAEMPLTEQVCKVIDGETSAKDAVAALMTRQKRHEPEELPGIF